MLPLEPCLPFPSGRRQTGRTLGLPRAHDDDPARDPLVGTWINDRFRLIAVIARGGMGSVYLAEQAPLGRTCAVKVLHPGCDSDPRGALEKRFWLEASVTSALSHPNIVTVFECGSTAGNLRYMAMEHLVGRTLGRAIREAGRFPEARAVHVASQICRALGAAHAAGVVHRDLKPSNVFLVERENEVEVAKVLDFGLVRDLRAGPHERLTEANLVLGSPRYMAPEQIRGERVDARTDIYALGVVLYEMMTGAVPFDGRTHGRTLEAHLNQEVPPMPRGDRGAGPSRRIERVIRRCLEKDPGRRFPSMADVLAALDPLGPSATGALSCPLGPGDGARSFVRRRGPERPRRADSVLRRRQLSAARMLRPFAFALAIAASAAVADRVWEPASVRAAQASALATTGRTPSGTPSGGSPATDDRLVNVAAAGPPSPPDQTVVVQVTSVPADSSVKEAGIELCPATPCAIVYDGAEASADAVHVLTVSRDGYGTETKAIRPTDGPVEVTLVPAPVRRRALAPATAPKNRDPPPLPAYRLEVPY